MQYFARALLSVGVPLAQDADPKTHSRSLRLLAIGLVLALIVLVYSLAEIRSSGRETVEQSTLLRPTRVLVSQALAYQYEQATDARDYVDLRQAAFRSAYASAGKRLDRVLDDLDTTLGAVHVPDALAPARDARQKLQQWRSAVAAPLLAHPGSKTTASLEARGASLVDRFRDDILQVSTVISRRFDSIRDTQIALLRRFSLVSGGVVLLLVVASIGAYFRERRLAEQRRRLDALQIAYDSERRVATTLQRAFLQQPLPEVVGIELDAVYQPAEKETQVGGDWYDAILLPDGRLLVSIGDVVGHGIDAAIMMNRARHAIAFAAVQEWDPGDVLTRANAGLLLDKATIVTAVCGFIDPAERCAVFASAGHPAPIIADASGEPRPLPITGLPLGIQPTTYESYEIRDLDDAVIVLLTDGALEYNHDVIAGEAALLEAVKIVKASGSLRPAREIYNRVFEHASARDDVAILTIAFTQRNPAAPDGE